MAFQLSPGVLVTERDDTLSVPSVSTTAGGFVGNFQWGPAEQVTQVDSEKNLVAIFGKPTTNTYISFFTAANFLSYGNNLKVIRAVSADTKNAGSNTAVLVKNDDHYETLTFTNTGEWVARFPGTLGNSLKVSMADANTFGTWAYKTQFSSTAPNTSSYVGSLGGAFDELHVVVLDSNGSWTGAADTVLEKFSFLSKASDAKALDGSTNYYKTVINNTSKYIRWANHTANTSSNTNWGSASGGVIFANLSADVTMTLNGGTDLVASAANILSQYTVFANDELYDINLIPVGDLDVTNVTSVINNVAEVRKDCMVFASPRYVDVVNNTTAVTNVVNLRNSLPSSSYAVMDSGWKYQYDRYNDVYRWIPLNGDIAGLTARSDFVADPWFSPAGFNRGQIKNVVKLAYSPSKSDRDTLYRAGVNPVVTFPGQGTVLFGDKTLLARPSAFDRINVRRLFIVLEKAIATASKFQLFEFNDAFTRAQFRNLVEPYLRDVQGRRGITDFRVVCDETNNTAEVIDRNEFVADIYVKPARSINFVQLNFIATRSGISFEELGA